MSNDGAAFWNTVVRTSDGGFIAQLVVSDSLIAYTYFPDCCSFNF